MTTIYIARHSQPFRDLLGEYCADEQEQIKNEKNPLSVLGDKRLKKWLVFGNLIISMFYILRIM